MGWSSCSLSKTCSFALCIVFVSVNRAPIDLVETSRQLEAGRGSETVSERAAGVRVQVLHERDERIECDMRRVCVDVWTTGASFDPRTFG